MKLMRSFKQEKQSTALNVAEKSSTYKNLLVAHDTGYLYWGGEKKV